MENATSEKPTYNKEIYNKQYIINNNIIGDTPKKISLEFFELKEQHQIWIELVGKYPGIEGELRKFCNYWEETNSTGNKKKWQLQKTFEVKRRLYTWIDNGQKWNKAQPISFEEQKKIESKILTVMDFNKGMTREQAIEYIKNNPF